MDRKKKCYVWKADYSIDLPEAEDDLATEALVLMICGITGHWKHPILYFLQNKISASVQTQLIKYCFRLLHSENLHVTALVFDNVYNNQSAATQLGCKMENSSIQTSFPIHRSPTQRYTSSLMCVI